MHSSDSAEGVELAVAVLRKWAERSVASCNKIAMLAESQSLADFVHGKSNPKVQAETARWALSLSPCIFKTWF